MRIVCLYGGSTGLYFTISMKLLDAGQHISVIEHNKPNDTSGWVVVLCVEMTPQKMQYRLLTRSGKLVLN